MNFCKIVMKLAVALAFALFLSFNARAASYTWTGTAGDNLWGTAANWGGTAPSSGTDTIIIGDTATNRTIYYDSTSTVNTVTTLNFTQTTPGVVNTIRFIKPGMYFTLSNNSYTLGNGTDNTALSVLYLDASQNQTTTTAASATFDIGTTSGSGTLTLVAGGKLVLNGYAYYTGSSTTGYVSKLKGNLVINGGTLWGSSVYNSSSVSTAIQNEVTGTVSMSSGTIYVDTSTSGLSNRLLIDGDVSITGGTITFADTLGHLILAGSTNTINATSVSSSTGSLSLAGSGAQSLTTSNYFTTLVVRTKGIKTVSSSYSVGVVNFGSLNFAVANGLDVVTLKLASNLSFSSIATYSTQTSENGTAIDLAGYTMTLQNTSSVAQSWTPKSTDNTHPLDWFITNTSSTTAYLTAASFDFSTTAYSSGISSGPNAINVGYTPGATLTAGNYGITGSSSSTGIVVLKAVTAGGTNNLSANGSINPTSRFWYAPSSGSGTGTLTSTRTIGKLEVGTGSYAATLKLTSSTLTVAGDVKVNASGIFDLGGQQLSMTSSANLTGKGTFTSSVSNAAAIVFQTGATGGFSPGGAANADSDYGVGNVGTLTFTSSTNFTSTGVQLASTSNSYFDIASSSSYDVVNLGGVKITYAGTLQLNFMSYSPGAGTTFQIFTNESASSTGTFSSITSNLAGYTFAFDNTTGTLSITAIPEPSFTALISIAALLWVFTRISRRKNTQNMIRALFANKY